MNDRYPIPGIGVLVSTLILLSGVVAQDIEPLIPFSDSLTQETSSTTPELPEETVPDSIPEVTDSISGESQQSPDSVIDSPAPVMDAPAAPAAPADPELPENSGWCSGALNSTGDVSFIRLKKAFGGPVIEMNGTAPVDLCRTFGTIKPTAPQILSLYPETNALYLNSRPFTYISMGGAAVMLTGAIIQLAGSVRQANQVSSGNLSAAPSFGGLGVMLAGCGVMAVSAPIGGRKFGQALNNWNAMVTQLHRKSNVYQPPPKHQPAPPVTPQGRAAFTGETGLVQPAHLLYR